MLCTLCDAFLILIYSAIFLLEPDANSSEEMYCSAKRSGENDFFLPDPDPTSIEDLQLGGVILTFFCDFRKRAHCYRLAIFFIFMSSI